MSEVADDPRTFAEVAKGVTEDDVDKERHELADGVVNAINGVFDTKAPHTTRGKHRLRDVGCSRYNEAVDAAHPHGTTELNHYSRRHAGQSVLQQHLLFFDRDRDGVIRPYDTFVGFYQLGFGIILSIISTLIIHTFFAYPTKPGLLPDPFFRIYVEKIYRDKHGSDTGSYDNFGWFVPEKFELMFERYSSLPNKDGFTVSDNLRLILGQRSIFDPIGWGAAVFEWIATWVLLRPSDWVIKKEDLRGVYDGSIFWTIAKRRGVDIKLD